MAKLTNYSEKYQWFVENLLQKVFDNLDKLCPDLHVNRKGNGWVADSGWRLDDNYKGFNDSNQIGLKVLSDNKVIFQPRGFSHGSEYLSIPNYCRHIYGGDGYTYLADKLGVPLPSWWHGKNVVEIDRKGICVDLQSILNYCLNNLEEAQPVLDYAIKERGYNEELVRKIGGYFPGHDVIVDLLLDKGYTQDQINQHLLTKRDGSVGNLWLNSWTTPVYDYDGTLRDFFSRSIPILDNPANPKYLYTPGYAYDDFVIGYKKGVKDFIFVEGNLDSSYIPCDRIVGMGSATLSEKQILPLIERGMTSAVFCFDNDSSTELQKQHNKQIKKNIEICRNNGVYKIKVLDIGKFSDQFKDPDEVVRYQGLGVFLDMVKDADPHYIWTATQELEDPNLNDLLLFANQYTPSEQVEIRKEYQPSIGFSDDEWHGQLSIINQQWTKSQLKILIDSSLQKDDVQEGINLLKEKLSEIETPERVLKEYEPPSELDIAQRWATAPSGVKTGFISEKGYDLEISPSALNLFSARTGHGKTTLCIQTCINVLKANSDAKITYLHYEEHPDDMEAKFLSCYLNMPLSEVRTDNIRAIYDFHKYGESMLASSFFENQNVELFKQKKSDWFENFRPRLRLKKIDWSIEKLEFEVKDAVRDTLLILDYVQLIPAHQHMSRNTRTEQMLRICQTLEYLASDLKMPILMGAQLKRGANTSDGLDGEAIADSDAIMRCCAVVYTVLLADQVPWEKIALYRVFKQTCQNFGLGPEHWEVLTDEGEPSKKPTITPEMRDNVIALFTDNNFMYMERQKHRPGGSTPKKLLAVFHGGTVNVHTEEVEDRAIIPDNRDQWKDIGESNEYDEDNPF